MTKKLKQIKKEYHSEIPEDGFEDHPRVRKFVHSLVKLFNRLSGYKVWAKGHVPEI